MYDLFDTDAIGGNNHGFYSNPEFDALVDQAKAETDAEAQGELFRQAESILLNEDIGAIPFNWYRGDYVYNPETVSNFPQTNLGLILWEQVTRQQVTPEVRRFGEGVSRPPRTSARAERRMTSYIIRRVLLIIPTVFLALSFLFFLFFLLPGDPAELLAGGGDRAVDPGVIERAEARYGLDDPIPEQFVRLLEPHDPLGSRRLVPEQPQRQRDPRRARGRQPPARHLGDPHRDRRRDLGRDHLRDPKIFVAGPS